MSGGQKQRIQLARAVYSDADIYLLDDPFSAVDAHTAAILFHDCVMDALAKKTVILVTHQVEFLSEVDKILVMESGQVTQSGIIDLYGTKIFWMNLSSSRGIQKQISTSSKARKLIALSFLRISLAYMEFKRIYEGTYLTRNQKQPSYYASLVDWIGARIVAAILWPLHVLGTKLVYSKIHSAIGISKAGISGGGSLPAHIDKFFEAIGVKVQNGYGLTESSPVVAARRPNCNVLGSVGHPLRHTEFKVVDSETGEVLPPGSSGIVNVRGPQVMKGYYKNPDATKQVLDEDGWLSTGDIGWIAPHHSIGRSRRCGGVVVLEGRAKDTIVLSTGENVEPVELEEAAMRSSLIQQIVVIGQDQRRLGAIIVPNKEEALLAATKTLTVDANTSDLSRDKLTGLLYEELRKWTSWCSFQIGPILIVDEPFTIDSGLMTPTMKIRRDKVVAQFKEQIDELYKQNS